ncbi:F-box domain-containing protein [Hirschfeldia incana]|nr:F-box domain-containing protein [Hirschfeldia incana]
MALALCDIPEDLQLRILSFLSPPEICSFACTSKRFASLCREDRKIWRVMCDQKWGKNTQIQKWGNGRIAYKLLYRTLNRLEDLIGFWRLCGRANPADSSPPLVFFEWGSSFVLGSRVLATNDDTYRVRKTPFLVLGISSEGRTENFLDLDGNHVPVDLSELERANLVPVDVNFMGSGHIMVEENPCLSKGSSSSSGEDEEGREDVVVTEMYTQLANRTSPGGDRRRKRKKEKERQARIKWEPEHFIKVSDFSPTFAKPLQGLWKGFCEGRRNMELYLVKYDEVGGVVCKKVEDLSLSRQTSPVFWTPNHVFMRSPFSVEEEMILDSRIHITPLHGEVHEQVVSGMLYMNSSYDPGEGRVWLYENGTFGFGFLRDQFITDLKRVALEDGCLADALDA